MAGKEIMTDDLKNTETKWPKGKSASDNLLEMIENEYGKMREKSLYFRFKEKQLREKFESDRAEGKKDTGKKTEYACLCEKYEDAKNSGDTEKYLGYFLYVRELLGGNGYKDYIRSGKYYFQDGTGSYKDTEDLKDFKERWNGYLRAFGVDEFLGENDIKAVQISEAFRALELKCDAPELDPDEVAEVSKRIHAEVLKSCIHKAVKNDFENFRDSKSINRDLLDFCGENDLLSVGIIKQKAPLHKERIEECAKILQDIYEIDFPELISALREDYETIFIPLEIDYLTGVSFCIVGKESFREHYYLTGVFDDKTGGKKYVEFLNNPFPCIPAVLHFTDVAFGAMICSSQYEIQSDYVRGELKAEEYYCPGSSKEQRKEMVTGFCERVYSEFDRAKKDAKNLLREKDDCKEKVESLAKSDFYRGIYVEVSHTPEAQKKKEEFGEAFDLRRKRVKIENKNRNGYVK